MKTIIIYGSTTGNAENAAIAIGREIENSVVEAVEEFNLEDLKDYDLVVLGTSTGGLGEIQDDWYDKVDELKSVDLGGKKVALFGTGDQDGYPDSFAGGLGELYNSVVKTNADIIGKTSTEGYDYTDSEAEVEGVFVGLVLDDDNQAQLTDERIKNWAKQLQQEV